MCKYECKRLGHPIPGGPEAGEASVSTWLNIATWWTCLIVTVVGLLLSFVAWRKKGTRSGLRGIAWSLLPIAMYLTHAIRLVGRLGSAIVQFGASFVFSPKAWLGVILVGLSALLFLASGGIPLVGGKRQREKAKRARLDAGRDGVEHVGPSVPETRQQPTMAPADDDLGDVQEILRRHGIK
jgi:hypothetical protein